MNCNNYQKSTLVATGSSATIPAGGTITIGTTQRITGTAITMGTNNTSINLKKAGLYRVSVSASAEGTTDATAISIQLNRNGVALADGFATFTPATAEGNVENMAFSTIVEVDTTTGTGYTQIPLTLTSTGGEAVYTYIQIAIDKIA